MKVLELIIDAIDEFTGVDAVALVEEPAIQADFYAFNNDEVLDVISSNLIKHMLFDQMKGEQNFSYDTDKAKNKDVKIEPTKVNFALHEDQQMVVGPLMVPDKLILRVDEEGQPYYVFFSQKTITKIAEKMMKFGNNNSLNVEHDPNKPVDGYMTSIWMVEDVLKDKQQIYGFNFPVGTLMGQYKIEDLSVWQKVKDGEIKGFSVEGFFNDRFVQAAKTNI
tara:strand:+ start:832 stop:1494 length:663 start_codon:yes stop_codon:yes gene_type:complete